ncbi:hypothetical protein [Niabella hibiscisoli]|uniref:hypothetical protein n=1 Tax=Niabella hibiscisoli TaxID=1825928 RepID=UPI001F0E4804|nr:hypothetical protein [Niabella hibiscisoli]MCH5720919.1 hypothetical protein [Niabella hibiscisoli]
MPIRMTDDQNGQDNDYNNDRGRGLRIWWRWRSFALLPLLLSLFRGKKIIFLLVIGAALWFLWAAVVAAVAI